MKRIEKVNNLVGLELKRENGELFSFSMKDILDVSVERIEGRTFSKIKLANGFEVLYRNTLVYTFYQITEGEPVANIAEVETACAEEVPEVKLDLENIDFENENTVEVADFYDKVWKELVTIENEVNIVYGLVDENNIVYIPIEKGAFGERCSIFTVNNLAPIITERAEINNKIFDLNRKNRNFDTCNYEFTGKQNGKKYMLSKTSCDMVVRAYFKGNKVIGFVDGDKVMFPIETKTQFFSVMSLVEFNLSEITIERTLYKKYKSQKKNKGISDISYSNMFNYMNF